MSINFLLQTYNIFRSFSFTFHHKMAGFFHGWWQVAFKFRKNTSPFVPQLPPPRLDPSFINYTENKILEYFIT